MKLLQLVDQAEPSTINAALTSNLKGVARWATPVTVYSPGAAAAVSVRHDLNAVPNLVLIESFIDGRVWSDEDDRRMWNQNQIVFRSSHQGRFVVHCGTQ
jgi:hypothetical protein